MYLILTKEEVSDMIIAGTPTIQPTEKKEFNIDEFQSQLEANAREAKEVSVSSSRIMEALLQEPEVEELLESRGVDVSKARLGLEAEALEAAEKARRWNDNHTIEEENDKEQTIDLDWDFEQVKKEIKIDAAMENRAASPVDLFQEMLTQIDMSYTGSEYGRHELYSLEKAGVTLENVFPEVFTDKQSEHQKRRSEYNSDGIAEAIESGFNKVLTGLQQQAHMNNGQASEAATHVDRIARQVASPAVPFGN